MTPKRQAQPTLFDRTTKAAAMPTRRINRNPILSKLALLAFVDLTAEEKVELDAELERIGMRRAAR